MTTQEPKYTKYIPSAWHLIMAGLFFIAMFYQASQESFMKSELYSVFVLEFMFVGIGLFFYFTIKPVENHTSPGGLKKRIKNFLLSPFVIPTTAGLFFISYLIGQSIGNVFLPVYFVGAFLSRMFELTAYTWNRFKVGLLPFLIYIVGMLLSNAIIIANSNTNNYVTEGDGVRKILSEQESVHVILLFGVIYFILMFVADMWHMQRQKRKILNSPNNLTNN